MISDDQNMLHANLAWCMAVSAATRAAELLNGVEPGELPIERQYDIAAALGAGLASYAKYAEIAGVTWATTHELGIRELEEASRSRSAPPT